MTAIAGILLACLALNHSAASAEAPQAGPRYRLAASVSLGAPQVRGTVEIEFTNDSSRALDHALVLLFANRFATPDAGVDDVNRPFIYPREEFKPGRIDVLAVHVGGRQASTTQVADVGLPEGTGMRVDFPGTLAPAAATTITMEFETFVPERFGTFGVAEGMLTALGGWYPMLAWLQPDGTWAADALPALADFEVELTGEPNLSVLLNGLYFPAPSPVIRTSVGAVHYLTLMAAPDLLRDEVEAAGSRVVLYHRPPQRAHRISFGASQLAITLALLQQIVELRPSTVPPPAGALVVVEAPLRWRLTAPGDGMVVISDRAFKVLWLVRPFHERRVAQAVYAELLRPGIVARETPRDAPWVGEGIGHTLARRYLATSRPDTRSPQDWIDLLNIFAVVDRFETAPKIPFVETVFDNVGVEDPLHERLTTFNNQLPPGHVVLGKLRQRLGDEAFQQVVDDCASSTQAWKQCSAEASGVDLSEFYDQWLQPYPEINYRFTSLSRNHRYGSAFVTELHIERQASRPIEEPVDVELRTIGGQRTRLRWDGRGDSAQLAAVTVRPAYQAVIDPDRKLIETVRADNASPPALQVVLDTAEVEVSSTEFGFSGLVVARGRYDYRKDLGLLGFYTNRSIGMAFGPRLHWGEPNDANTYRHNLYAFYGLQGLNASFRDQQHPEVRTAGHSNNLGLRYEYNTIFSYNNPTDSVRFRLFADWFDRALGSDYDYVDWGGGLVVTHPLWTHRTVFAGEVFNGFSEPLGSSLVPNQGLYSLGGSRSIRGIGAEEELGRNIFLLRAELRQAIYPDVDLNLFDALVLRRGQLRAFVDTGQVSNSAGRAYNPEGYAVGVGIGFTGVYEFFGFFPLTAYLELATQARGPGSASDIQVLFGTRQPF